MMKPRPELDFKSKEEFRDVCRRLSGRLHYLNRTAIGESKFVSELAELVKRAGKVFDEHYDDKDVFAAFGDGWEPGTLSRDERPLALFGLLYPEVGSDKS
ncbi:hypothetical protein ACSQ76_20060 [Roseovarius sp. B08]|uniref:hypothetical protein n=1 Tax=Roseovarius sp. B08 TaxID=3449223 RepID=UPI003EDC8F0D